MRKFEIEKREKLKREKPLVYEKIIQLSAKEQRGECASRIDIGYNYACNLKCNPSLLNHLRSPVLMQWNSDALMYVELYQNPPGRPVDGFPHKRDRSGQTVDLGPGTYEMKIRQHEDDDCISSTWFEVIPGR